MAEMTKDTRESTGRARELRIAWRTIAWHVLRRPEKDTLSRRVWLKIAVGHVRCGLATGGKHWWGPLRAEYEGQRRRKRKCRLCGAKMTPASEIAADPPSPEEMQRAEQLATHPTEADVQRAVESARKSGLLKGDEWLWD